jgi:hypothetical protein
MIDGIDLIHDLEARKRLNNHCDLLWHTRI